PEAYFIYGGPYYGINYNYVVNEDNEILDEEISPETLQDLDAFHSTRKKYSRDPRKKAFKKANFYKDLFSHDMSNVVQNIRDSSDLIFTNFSSFDKSKITEFLETKSPRTLIIQSLIKSPPKFIT
ncbi:MAG: hypothetical protein ACTSSP_11300, partial [Candidatus Asgardarchaeia archaeon]